MEEEEEEEEEEMGGGVVGFEFLCVCITCHMSHVCVCHMSHYESVVKIPESNSGSDAPTTVPHMHTQQFNTTLFLFTFRYP